MIIWLLTNGDQFNEEIKLLANRKYIESAIYTLKKEKFASDDYRKKQEDVATAAFEQESFNSGLILYFHACTFFKRRFLFSGWHSKKEFEIRISRTR